MIYGKHVAETQTTPYCAAAAIRNTPLRPAENIDFNGQLEIGSRRRETEAKQIRRTLYLGKLKFSSPTQSLQSAKQLYSEIGDVREEWEKIPSDKVVELLYFYSWSAEEPCRFLPSDI